MSKPSRKPKPTAKRATRRSRTRRKPRFITASEARRRAARHLLRRMLASAEVRDGAKTRWSVYDCSGKLASKPVWLVYPNPAEPVAQFRPSTIIAICKRTGRVLYEGSAGDEG